MAQALLERAQEAVKGAQDSWTSSMESLWRLEGVQGKNTSYSLVPGSWKGGGGQWGVGLKADFGLTCQFYFFTSKIYSCITGIVKS